MGGLDDKYQFNECGCTLVRGCLVHCVERVASGDILKFAGSAPGFPVPDWHVSDEEMIRIADEATEMQVLAAACGEEGWRVNKSVEQWFAERPCKAGRYLMEATGFCNDAFCNECHGTGFVRAGKVS